MVHSLFWPFSNQEIILSMNFDGGRVKIEVRGTLFCVFARKFYRLYRAYILKGVISAFFQSNLCFAYLNSRLIRPNQLETTFTGKKSTGECLKYNIFEFVFRIFFRGSMVLEVTWQKAGGQSGFKLQLSLVFFLLLFFFSFFYLFVSYVFLLFFLFLNPLVCFPFIPTAGALSDLHEVCDKHISELLGMIRCNKNNKIFMYRA